MTVYFIRAGEGGPIKIGYTGGSVTNRLRDLQVGCPMRLELIGSIEGTEGDEQNLHRELRDHQLVGEWFAPHPDVIRAVEKAIDGGVIVAAPPKRMRHENLACEIIDALGGNEVVARLTRSKPSAVSNWRAFGKFPANTFIIFRDALARRHLNAPVSLWGQTGVAGMMFPTNSDSSASRPDDIATAVSSAPVAAVAPVSPSATVRVQARQITVSADPLAGSQTVVAVSRVEHVDAVAAVTNFDAEVSTLEAQWARDELRMFEILQLDGTIGMRFDS